MLYIISFLEGVITFISPCLLPMLPVYLVYFAGGHEHGNTRRVLLNAFGFICGFTLLFVLLGTFAASLGRLLIDYQRIVNIITGSIIVIFGLNYIGILKPVFLNQIKRPLETVPTTGFFSAALFGIVFSISWTPCVGTFLGSALMLAANQNTVLSGSLLLLVYSLGLGIPFLLSAILIDQLSGAFTFIKKHYHIINIICGLLLIVTGIMIIAGYMNRLLAILSF